jgi:hypothetical protein
MNFFYFAAQNSVTRLSLNGIEDLKKPWEIVNLMERTFCFGKNSDLLTAGFSRC